MKAAIMTDTVEVEQAGHVTIENREDGYFIEVKGNKYDSDYHYKYERTLGNDSVEVVKKSEGRSDIDIPFTELWNKKRKRSSFEAHNAFFAIGFVNAMNAKKGGVNGSEGVKTNMSKSVEIFFNIATFSQRLNNSMGVFTGLGFNWRNWRMDGDKRFVKNGNITSLAPYPDGADIDFSRLKVFSLVVPFMWEVQQNKGKGFFFNLGPLVNINTYASYKTRYTIDGGKHKDIIKGVHQMPITIDLMAQAGYDNYGFYVKYSPMHIIQKDFGPQFNTLSCGLAVYF